MSAADVPRSGSVGFLRWAGTRSCSGNRRSRWIQEVDGFVLKSLLERFLPVCNLEVAFGCRDRHQREQSSVPCLPAKPIEVRSVGIWLRNKQVIEAPGNRPWLADRQGMSNVEPLGLGTGVVVAGHGDQFQVALIGITSRQHELQAVAVLCGGSPASGRYVRPTGEAWTGLNLVDKEARDPGLDWHQRPRSFSDLVSGEEPTDMLTQGVACVGSLVIRHVQIMPQRMHPFESGHSRRTHISNGFVPCSVMDRRAEDRDPWCSGALCGIP